MSALTVVETDLACDARKQHAEESRFVSHPTRQRFLCESNRIESNRIRKSNRIESNPKIVSNRIEPSPDPVRAPTDRARPRRRRRRRRRVRTKERKVFPRVLILILILVVVPSRRETSTRTISERRDTRAIHPHRASPPRPRSARARRRIVHRATRRLQIKLWTYLDLGRLEGGDAADEGGSEKRGHCEWSRVQE